MNNEPPLISGMQTSTPQKNIMPVLQISQVNAGFERLSNMGNICRVKFAMSLHVMNVIIIII